MKKTAEPEIAESMLALFAGYSKSSGTHGMPERDGQKWSIKKTAKTLNKTVTAELWVQHLAGKRPLGVVPIRDDSTSVWGSIDIDQYNINLLGVVSRVEELKFPLVPCRSKSGGLHLFLFTSEPVPAALMQQTLRNMAEALGFGDSEIFPKQTHIEPESSGSWMVMPYYGDTFDGKLQFQYGLKKTGAEMTLEEFVSVATKRRVSADQLRAYDKPTKPAENSRRPANRVSHHLSALPVDEPFGDGPPCLQYMAKDGFPEGGRNSALFHLGVYLKKAFPTQWKEKLKDDNQNYMRPPLPAEEVLSMQKQLEKKDYEYSCNNEPMFSHCDAGRCVTRSYGVGDGTGAVVITAMRKINSDDGSIWYVSIKGSNSEITITDPRDLSVHARFVTKCVDQLSKSFPPVSAAVWSKFVNAGFALMTEEQVSEDVTKFGHFKELLETFLTNRTRGNKKEDLLRGAPWECEEERRHYFRLADLQKSLERDGMRATRNEVTQWIRKLGGPDRSLDTSLKRTSLKLWWVPSDTVQEPPELDPPEMPKEKI